MPILYRDFETRSTLDLSRVGAHRYAADPTTEILCVGYAIDDGSIEIWTPGQPVPEEFIEAAKNPDWLVVAHNDGFESAIEEHVLNPRPSWPLIPLAQHRCTMAMALAGTDDVELGCARCHRARAYSSRHQGTSLGRSRCRRVNAFPIVVP